jgi:mono/diheme cytochrome c family protein
MSASLALALLGIAGPAPLPPQRPDFTSAVAPLLHAHCIACHRPGGEAPFPLLSYDDARARAEDIRSAVRSRRMPPWSAMSASGYPDLLHDPRLSAREIATIVSWIDAGTPAGNLSKPAVPPAFPASWALGLPDLTLSLPRAVSLPPDTSARAFNVVLYMNFPADRWITAIDYQPSSRDLLNHAVIFAAPAAMNIDAEDVLPGFAGLTAAGTGASLGQRLAEVDRSLESIGVWTPYARVWPAPDRSAIRLPKGTNLVMQFHARPTDTGAIEDGTVAIYFSKTAPVTSLTSLQVPSSLGIVAGLDIPAGQPRALFRDELTLPIDVTAFGARGHAHELGRDLKLTARLPNGSVRGLLWIDRWETRWQQSYYFAAPIKLPKGTKIQVEITYDNSPDNPRNPSSPPRRVLWGPRLGDEVSAMDLIIATPDQADAAALASARTARFREQLLKTIAK